MKKRKETALAIRAPDLHVCAALAKGACCVQQRLHVLVRGRLQMLGLCFRESQRKLSKDDPNSASWFLGDLGPLRSSQDCMRNLVIARSLNA